MKTRSLVLLALVIPFVLGFQQCTPGIEFDFDDDGRADVSVFRPSDGSWWIYRSRTGVTWGTTFGLSTDTLVPGDYTGDRRTDIAIYRSGEWFILRSQDSTYYGFPFGLPGDIPVPANYDITSLDNRTDPAVYRPSNGTWYIYRSNFAGMPPQLVIQQFGRAEDRPVPADYDGDTLLDLAVFRPSTGVWYINRSSSQLSPRVVGIQFGLGTDTAVPADYTGDRKADIAIFRPETGFWYILRSEGNSYYGFQLGSRGDIPSPADYDGDGKTDAAVFSGDGVWYMLKSTTGYEAGRFGMYGDEPVAGAYVRTP